MYEYLMSFIQVVLFTNAHNIMVKEKPKCRHINKSWPDFLKKYIDLRSTEKKWGRNTLKHQ